ncbi:MAG: hypothetical protein A3E37_03130 [Candidatus Andersenbacteria bacterium RIFCSPHIGHO2_12_FULL_46_9]|nr:MAG: hypothetical protein UW94_C0005G0005 [Parcubacteria group bacterium GW2011_GWA2_45_14]OGY35529.1 MAG: hypothetical protein A3B76_02010 [Candidatus Andersenbacteria bacterium RIFCSPHIGHO2_02_FULL_46_16]OGY37712.1 MAG: hypothetical protein A3E37_03130 [Candidatus Andersenbacteria bacterium RIFCSPHIGHO2_12_FULL_46_9]OGY37977.1 MAG: hypothetical protein A3I08_01815 [Candidatus Andersenbacteria bacterium RIFCSPLOWO2_02_FULL_46_11]OGY41503.1 MAG: hypothetical protein A3G57_00735 [Candidatus A
MTRSQITAVVLVGVVLLLVLGLIAVQVGGSFIRTSGEVRIGQLILSNNKILPGAPVTVTYSLIELGAIDDASMVMVRTPTESTVISEVTKEELGSGTFIVTVPCDKYEELEKNKAGRFVLVLNSDQRVLAQSESFTLLPAGPECIYR